MTDTPDDRAALQRVLMDRARDQAGRQWEKAPRRVLPRMVAGAAALGVVFLVLLGFDAFLTSVQKVLRLEVTAPEPAVTGPMPAYVVPAEPAEPADPER